MTKQIIIFFVLLQNSIFSQNKTHNKKIKWENVIIKEWNDSTVLTDVMPFKHIYEAFYAIETTADKVQNLPEKEIIELKKFTAKKRGNLIYIKMKPEYYNRKQFFAILILYKK